MPDNSTARRAGAQRAAASPEDIRVMARALHDLLGELHGHYERIGEMGAQRDEAIAGAETKRLAMLLREESLIVEQLIGLERKRAGILAFFVEQFNARSVEDVSVTWISEHLEDADLGEALVQRGTALRALIEHVRERDAAARLGVETLASHMQGLLRSVAETLSHSGAYGRSGDLETGAPVSTSLDLTT